jgi:hypothetical protein
MKDKTNNTVDVLEWPGDCLDLAGTFPDFPLCEEDERTGLTVQAFSILGLRS